MYLCFSIDDGNTRGRNCFGYYNLCWHVTSYIYGRHFAAFLNYHFHSKYLHLYLHNWLTPSANISPDSLNNSFNIDIPTLYCTEWNYKKYLSEKHVKTGRPIVFHLNMDDFLSWSKPKLYYICTFKNHIVTELSEKLGTSSTMVKHEW